MGLLSAHLVDKLSFVGLDPLSFGQVSWYDKAVASSAYEQYINLNFDPLQVFDRLAFPFFIFGIISNVKEINELIKSYDLIMNKIRHRIRIFRNN
jgi:hypothetical protein